MSNPLDEFLDTYVPTEKTAAFPFGKEMAGRASAHAADLVGKAAGGGGGGFAQNFGNAMAGGAGAAAATTAIGAAAVGVRALYNAATSARDFREMLSHNEDLRAHHEADPRRVNQYYASLRTMNPSFAKDPIVAGTYMRQMIENPLNAGGTLANTVGSRAAFPSVLDRAEDDAMSTAKSHFAKKQPGKPGV